MAVTESPWKSARDSPSRQLLWELSRLAITAQEDLYERLDRDSQEREAAHKSALAEAIAKHEKVRKDAEAERDRLEKQMLQERERRAAEARQEEERQRRLAHEREKAEKQRAAERAETAARAERAATEERNAELARQKAEKDRQTAKAEQAKAEIEKKADDERKVKEEAAAAAAAASTAAAQKAQITTSTAKRPAAVTQGQIRNPQREAEHQWYLEIHKNLKELRKSMVQQAKEDPKLKSRMGDMRRDIKKSVGQIIEGKGKNTKPVSRSECSIRACLDPLKQQKKIMDTLREAIVSFPQPTINVATLTARPIQEIQAPAFFIYLMNQFAKAVVSQFIDEAAVFAKVADPVGTIAISMFARDENRISGMSLIDILIAKFHAVCPPLFGIHGSESTDEGRTRLGWRREEGGGPWVSEQNHQDRMTGLGAGYAALSLRNFENSRMSNPYPPYNFWRALTGILNVPAGQITETHFILLRALLMNSEARFLEFFGNSAKMLLRIAVVEYPKRADKGSVAAKVLSTLGDAMKRDKKLYFCLRNVVSMFHVIEKETRWRKENNRPERFEALKKSKPIVAVGADEPLGGERMKAAYYHGADGLGGVHNSHPHHSSPSETWKHLFDSPPPGTVLSSTAASVEPSTSPNSYLFTPSSSPSHLEILRILETEPPDTVTLIAIGPLTTIAIAAAHAPATFLRAKQVVVMGGAVNVPGNMTPVGEFNTIADAVAAARVYSLTSPDPESTMPPFGSSTSLPDYPTASKLGDRRLRVVKMPLDVTKRHSLRRDEVKAKLDPLKEKGSPLAEWMDAFLAATFKKVESLHHGHEAEGHATYVELHDPLCVWYAATSGGYSSELGGWEFIKGEDIRIETVGQWTRGMCVVDRRDRKKAEKGEEEVDGDMGEWLSWRKGNRVDSFPELQSTPAKSPTQVTTMAPSTADRWFVSDAAYHAATRDYAVSGCTTQEIKQDTLDHDFEPRYFLHFPTPRSFAHVHDLIRHHRHGYAFATLHFNTLIFADVDQSNPDHEKETRANAAAAEELEKPTEQNDAVRAKIVTELLDAWKKRAIKPPPDMPDFPVEKLEFTEDSVGIYFHDFLGSLPPDLFGIVAGLSEEEERKEALMLMSGQLLMPTEVQRPVLVLVNIIDTAQSTTIGASQGYRIAYDPLSKELIIRPYTSDEQTHPLGDSWYADLPVDDGICFRGPHKDFVARFLAFMKDINEDRVQAAEAEGFKFLVWAAAMEWLVGQWYCFFDESEQMFQQHDDDGGLAWEDAYKAFRQLEKKFSTVKFPLPKARKVQERYKGDDVLDIEVLDFKERVEELEGFLREAAVG
ncbi:MAG: hypothetical protein Q9216_003720, partial [Gyalolechia sp. 2 TL-2023]